MRDIYRRNPTEKHHEYQTTDLHNACGNVVLRGHGNGTKLRRPARPQRHAGTARRNK
jgi:hypothetical protein